MWTHRNGTMHDDAVVPTLFRFKGVLHDCGGSSGGWCWLFALLLLGAVTHCRLPCRTIFLSYFFDFSIGSKVGESMM